MDKTMFTKLALTISLVALGTSSSHPFLRPLCKSQFALANHYCGKIPYELTPSPSSTTTTTQVLLANSFDIPLQYDNRQHGQSHGVGTSSGHGHGQGQGHDTGHADQSPTPHQTSSTHQSGPHRSPPTHQSGPHRSLPTHRSGPHRSSPTHQSGPQEECCRWLRNLDDSCVCDLLVYLPVSLSKPNHGYTVAVYDGCEVKFKCPGRLFKP